MLLEWVWRGYSRRDGRVEREAEKRGHCRTGKGEEVRLNRLGLQRSRTSHERPENKFKLFSVGRPEILVRAYHVESLAPSSPSSTRERIQTALRVIVLVISPAFFIADFFEPTEDQTKPDLGSSCLPGAAFRSLLTEEA